MVQSENAYRALEKSIGYKFQDSNNLMEALTHSSIKVDEAMGTSRELAYLGDSFLYYWVTKKLLEKNPGKSKGSLDQIRQSRIKNDHLKEVGDRIGISEFVILGKSRKGMVLSNKMTATVIEALIGAIVMEDEGEAKKFIEKFIF
jgi:ribonuclease III